MPTHTLPADGSSATRFLPVRAAARESGISEQLLRRLIQAGSLRAYRVGKTRLVVDRDDLVEFVLSRPVTGPAAVRDGRRNGRKPGPKPRSVSSR